MILSTLRASLCDFVLFQACWFACVLGGAGDLALMLVLATAGFLAVHLVFLTARGRRAEELCAVLLLGGVGVALESIGVRFGSLCFHREAAAWFGLPTFMVALWFSFPPLLDTCLRWMRGRTAIAVLFGVVGGPLAYLGGEKLGALSIGSDRTAALIAIGAIWAIYTPLAVVGRARMATRRADG